jgi:predicted glycosyltransferase involved in capsule biosynthesis
MIDLSDCTFTIPVRIESQDRMKNLALVLNYLHANVKTTVIIGEMDSKSLVKTIWQPHWSSFCQHMYVQDLQPIFHKTRCLNMMAKATKTPIIVSHDSDVLMYPEYYKSARDVIAANQLDFCYPFNDALQNIPRGCFDELYSKNNLDVVKGKTTAPHALPPPGGCFFMNKNKFMEAGMENENFRGYGAEDSERLIRVQKLGYRVARLAGTLYHMDHIKISASSEQHENVDRNRSEFNKIQMLNTPMLRQYIQNWEWRRG